MARVRDWLTRIEFAVAGLVLCATGCKVDAALSTDVEFSPPVVALPKILPAKEAEAEWRLLPLQLEEQAPFLWWEAEAFSKSNFPQHHDFEPQNAREAQVLSGGKWIGASQTPKGLFAEYSVKILEEGDYSFYSRKFWLHGAFRWRFDDGQWQNCDEDVALLDGVSIRKFVVANWVNLGRVHLTRGAHRLRLEIDSGEQAVAFDAFVLAAGQFIPRGKLKPGQSFATPEEGWINFDPPADSFQNSSVDLSSLNQDKAGEEGRVSVAHDELIFSKTKKPVRFWSNNAGHDVLTLSLAAKRRYARLLSKRGVNLVRLHGAIFSPGEPRSVNERKLASVVELVDILREEGIYIGLSIYFPLWLNLKAEHGFIGYKGQNPFGLPYFSSAFEQMYRKWWRALLTTRNAAGEKLVDDPAVAYVELINEDSTLFWTFVPYETIPLSQTIVLEKQFAEWLSQRYGSVTRALETWKGERIRGDEPRQQRVGLLPLWNVANDKTLRAQETAEFLARLMKETYGRWVGFLQDDLGFKGLTVCSNWQTADNRVLGPLDDWANTVCDVMDRHGYFSGDHQGDTAAYEIAVGQTYWDRSALRFDAPKTRTAIDALDASRQFEMPHAEPRYNGKPAFASELGWPRPNRFRTEGPLFTAAYASLSGVDGLMFFASSDTHWPRDMKKFSISDPAFMGQYPVAARLFREGMVQKAKPIATVHLSEKQIFGLQGAPYHSAGSLDQLRAKDVPPGSALKVKEAGELDPLSLLVGPVDLSLGADSGRADTVIDLSPWVNRSQKRVSSRTGEIVLDYGQGVLRIKAPEVEAQVGFLGRARIFQLPHMIFNIKNEYASVGLIALDRKPIVDSDHLLLQVGTEVKNSGYATKSVGDDGKKQIIATGGQPILVREIEGSIRLQRPGVEGLRIVALDANGAPLSEPKLHGLLGFPLLPGVLYYEITSEKK